MENNIKPIIEFEGITGSTSGKLELYNNFIRLKKEGLISKHKKDIYFQNIASTQITKPVFFGFLGGFIYGYIYFVLLGDTAIPIRDENMFSFKNDEYNKALEIKKYIKERVGNQNFKMKNNHYAKQT